MLVALDVYVYECVHVPCIHDDVLHCTHQSARTHMSAECVYMCVTGVYCTVRMQSMYGTCTVSAYS